MTSSLRLAGAAALCAALLLTACAKKTDQTTTSTDATSTASTTAPAGASTAPDAGSTPVAEVSAGTSPDATATGAPTAAATTATATSGTTSVTTSGGNGTSAGFITLPVYPGAAESKDGEMSATTNTGSVEMKVYTTKDDAKKVAEWYKSHLPASFKGGILTAGGKTIGTFADEHADGQGDQNVVVAEDSNASVTRIQLTTKHGK